MCRIRLAAVLLAALTQHAHAQDYPFTGTFTAAGSASLPGSDDLARCALAFFTQSKSGAYTNYVVDMNGFNTSKTLRYLVNAHGTCSYDPGHRLETCTTTFDVDKNNIGVTYVDVIDALAPDFVKLTNFDTAAPANDYYTTGKAEGGSPAAFARCPFDAARLAAAISTEITRLPPEKVVALQSPDAALLHAPITADLMKASGLSMP